ncbi:caspase family protein [Jejudonia soesokkakensis]|uniref:Caspase family protein n=1 Tax=Jejudonia soesokkakensis TaxID=1323432 RepID=A0ABW2MR49_9FLAO
MENGKLDNAFALIIGVGKDLPSTILDATDIKELLVSPDHAGYTPKNIRLLTDKKATRQNILKAFDWLIEKTNEDSSVFLYYSGHGGNYSDNDFLKKENWKPEEENRQYFHLCPYDYDEENYEATWIKAEEVKAKISELKSRRLIFFLDCCHAAGITQNVASQSSTRKFGQEIEADGLAQHLDNGRGMSIVSSCREDQLSVIFPDDRNSLYTKCMLEVLKGNGKTDTEDPFIRISEVVRYIFKKVPEHWPEQNPYANLQIYDDFAVSKIAKNLFEKQTEKVESNTSEETKQSIKKEVVINFRKTDNANNIVLFVHGFSGQAASTFGNIPNLLMEVEKMDGWDMLPVGFSENVNPEMGHNVWASLTDLSINASYLATSIKHNFAQYKRIAIVAHSLGGLVAQQALLKLKDAELKKISHVMFFATPSAGISERGLKELNQVGLHELSQNSFYITNLRKQWNDKFKDHYPFSFQTIAATKDSFVPIISSLGPFSEKYHAVIEGDHFGIVSTDDKDSDTFKLILNRLTYNKFYSQFSSSEEINIALGNYDEVIKTLLPNIHTIDAKGLEQLIFALEGADRAEEALEIIKNNPLAQDNSNLMGIIGGRFKRNYLTTFASEDGAHAFDYYSMGLTIAESKNDSRQIYYLAINLAFLSVLCKNDLELMTSYAQKALNALAKDPFNSVWKLATLGEANLYLGEFETSKTHYEAAAKMSGLREKLSIYTNAYNAYTTLMSTDNEEDDFIKFLKNKFLS